MTENVITTIISGAFMVFATAISAYFGYAQGKNRKIKCLSTLEHHPYFSRVESVKSEISRTFQLPNKGKERVFKDILFNNINILMTKNLDLVKEIERDEERYRSNSTLYILHLKNLESILSELTSYYERDAGFTRDEKEVMRIVMSKYSIWSKERIHNMQDQIVRTCNSPFYAESSPSIKTSIILDQYLSFTLDLVHSASQTLDKINGDLKGLVYRGITI